MPIITIRSAVIEGHDVLTDAQGAITSVPVRLNLALDYNGKPWTYARRVEEGLDYLPQGADPSTLTAPQLRQAIVQGIYGIFPAPEG